MHTLIDLRGNIPCFIRITHGKTGDVTVLDHLPVEPALYVMDKGYIDFRRLHAFTRQMAFLITRAKRKTDCTRRDSRPVLGPLVFAAMSPSCSKAAERRISIQLRCVASRTTTRNTADDWCF